MTNPTPAVLFLPGNGHSSVRLDSVRKALREDRSFELIELAYPECETFDELLDELAREVHRVSLDKQIEVVYATGIGGLVALALRSRGVLRETRLVLQGAVLWGLERRTFPRLMRLPLMPRLLTFAFTLPFIRRHFAKKHFRTAHPDRWLDTFFEGYRDARAFEKWFAWLTPALLRRLESELRDPEALRDVEVWWGDQDTVVGVDELRVTERALGVRLPLTTFPGWGHYPMIDDPHSWVSEVSLVLATARPLP